MADLNFGNTPEEALVTIKEFCRRLNSDFYGNGRAGFMERVLRFMDRLEGEEEQREKNQEDRHRENTEKLEQVNNKLGQRGFWVGLASFLVGIAALAVSVLAIWAMFYLAHHANTDPQKLFTHQPIRVLSSWEKTTQDAGGPTGHY